jgi:hypothetical protein
VVREPVRVEEQVRAKAAAMVRAGAKKVKSGVFEHKIPFYHKRRRIYHARIKSKRSHE